MTEPFAAPPPLGDDFESRARRRATQLRSRRRASIVSAVAAVMLMVGASFAVRAQGSHPDAKLHVAGGSSPEDASSTTRDDTSTSSTDTTASGVTTAAPRHTTTTATADTTPEGGSSGSGGVTPDTMPAGSGPSEETTTTTDAWPWSCPTPGTVTISTELHATPIGPGTWHVTGTVTIDNATGGAFGSDGYVLLAGATFPGTAIPAAVGWNGTEEVMIGSGFSVPFFVTKAHSVASYPMSQDLNLVAGANAAAPSAPTTVLSGSYMSSWSPPHMSCQGLDVVTDFTTTDFNPPPRVLVEHLAP